MQLYFGEAKEIRRVQKSPANFSIIEKFENLSRTVLITIPAEVISLRTGIYQYNDSVLDWPPYKIPVLDLPYMALICYALLMLFGPTFVRTWGPYFGGRRP